MVSEAGPDALGLRPRCRLATLYTSTSCNKRDRPRSSNFWGVPTIDVSVSISRTTCLGDGRSLLFLNVPSIDRRACRRDGVARITLSWRTFRAWNGAGRGLGRGGASAKAGLQGVWDLLLWYSSPLEFFQVLPHLSHLNFVLDPGRGPLLDATASEGL